MTGRVAALDGTDLVVPAGASATALAALAFAHGWARVEETSEAGCARLRPLTP